MTEDRTSHSGGDRTAEDGNAGRDARGRWKPGHCPNPNGRPKKKRFKDYNPSDIRHFMNTEIDVATADGPQKMDRRTALRNKQFEGAMKGKVTCMRMLMAEIKESDQQLAELRLHYDPLEAKLIHKNPDFKSIDECLTLDQKTELLGLAKTLNHYYPGEYGAILGETDDEVASKAFKDFKAKLARVKSEGGEAR